MKSEPREQREEKAREEAIYLLCYQFGETS